MTRTDTEVICALVRVLADNTNYNVVCAQLKEEGYSLEEVNKASVRLGKEVGQDPPWEADLE